LYGFALVLGKQSTGIQIKLKPHKWVSLEHKAP